MLKMEEIVFIWEDGAPTGHLSPNEAFSTGKGLHVIELLAKGVPWEPSKKPRLLPTQ